MKKTAIQLLTATAAFAMIAVQPMTAMAASLTCTTAGNAQYKIITGGKQNADIKELLGKLNLDCNTPGSGLPENPIPDQALPDQGGSGSQEAWLSQVVDLVNAERAKAGVEPLSLHSSAVRAAQVRAEETVHFFSHTRPDGRDFATALAEAGVSYSSAGENIAYGQSTPQGVMDQWMNSAGHRANILNPDFTAIGVGHYENGNGTDYWTQLFIG